ncbi:hypothetical protein [Solidesulfovibrio magneticus]|uniref:Uncharacterized protein n=1 Tax=Solidesulfovibrio magneticus (strain ATCC 700980 / DSM 13731 / RS-1) TaxID=573370 RepID=C4XTK1_SOLM1|nr:hypothetical protein [Solidesulfovibrio magneticus]BAH75998.1 hypothetical protein DMR_25070 [Solidesulfovibrio magneticus RS-1]
MAAANRQELLRRIHSQAGPVLHDVVALIDLGIAQYCRQLESCAEEQVRKLQGQIMALRCLRQELSGSKGLWEASGYPGTA